MTRLPRRTSLRVGSLVAPLALALPLTGCTGDSRGHQKTPASEAASSSAPPVPTVSSDAAVSGAAADAPKDTEVDAFCEAANSGPDELDDDGDKAADTIHSYADSLMSVGTPAEITGDARGGFEVLVDFFADIKGDEVEQFRGSGTPEDVLGDEEGAQVTAFFGEAVKLCATAAQPSATPTS